MSEKDEKNIPLPQNWQGMTDNEKDIWFHRHYIKYVREGETDGLFDWAPDEVKAAYEAFIKNN